MLAAVRSDSTGIASITPIDMCYENYGGSHGRDRMADDEKEIENEQMFFADCLFASLQ